MDCRCQYCNSLIATDLIGTVKIKCYKQHCKKFNIFVSPKQTGDDQQTSFIKDEKTVNISGLTDNP